MTGLRSLAELINASGDAWPLMQDWLGSAEREVEVLPADPAAAEETLLALQVTTRSVLGTLAYRTGGLLVDGGWLRLFGSGHPRIGGGLREWNETLGGRRLDPPISRFMLVGHDVLGGFFAINGGALPGEVANIHYWAPDEFGWEDMEMGHAQFVNWAMSSNVDAYYEPYRWPGWREEVNALGQDEAISFNPPLGFRGPDELESPPILGRTRSPVPAAELWYATHQFQLQIGDLPDGSSVNLDLAP